MTNSERAYRRVEPGSIHEDAVTVGIERQDGAVRAAIWWEAKGDVDADEAAFDTVPAALKAAEAARVLHGFDEVVVVLAEEGLWQPEWGVLQPDGQAREPIGDLRETDLSSDEAFELAADIEAERDA